MTEMTQKQANFLHNSLMQAKLRAEELRVPHAIALGIWIEASVTYRHFFGEAETAKYFGESFCGQLPPDEAGT
jgi:hypothetical protein